MIDFIIRTGIIFLLGAETIMALLIGKKYFFSKRDNFRFRYTLSISIVSCFYLLSSLIYYFQKNLGVTYQSGVYLFGCILVIALAFYCYKVDFFELARYFCIVFSLRFLGVALSDFFLAILRLSDMRVEAVDWLVRIMSVGALYVLLCFVLLKEYKQQEEERINKAIIIRLTIFFIVTMFLEVIKVGIEHYSLTYLIVFELCAVFYGGSAVLIEFAILNQGLTEKKVSVMKKLWDEDRKRYETQKELIEIVNIKCHDFRHQLRELYKGGDVTERAIKDVEKNIRIYDTFLKTNNEVLDVVLSNFYLRCQNSNIFFTCMADGEKLNFMDELDVYSFFGNILENALEYEQKVFPEEKRFISLVIKTFNGFLSVQAENYYEEGDRDELKGVFPTSKADKTQHGFGIKSMKRIAEKYGGVLDIYISNGIFQVSVLFPLKN